LQRENSSVCLLAKEVFGPFSGLSGFEEGQGLKDLFFFTTKLLQGQLYVQRAEVEENITTGVLSREVKEREQLGPSLLSRNNWSRG